MEPHHHLFPSYTIMERRVDAVIHVSGTGAAFIAVGWLLLHISGLSVTLSLIAYSLGLIATLSMSALYNMTPASHLKSIYRRADHATIYAMIAGTYTPLVVNRLHGAIGLAIGMGVWLAAAAGIFLALEYPRRYEKFKMGLYLAMGWMIAPELIPLSHAIAPASLWLLVAGGILYSLGAGVYLLKRLPFHNAIWHAMVLVAASLHFAAMVIEFAF